MDKYKRKCYSSQSQKFSQTKHTLTLFKFYPFQSSTRLTKRATGQHAILLSFILSFFFVEMDIDHLLEKMDIDVLMKRAR
jgi:hypothetical protein